jgi:hypothetical protein
VAKLSNSACLSAGSSNHNAELAVATKGSQARSDRAPGEIEPETVIIPVAEYDAIMQLVEQAEAQTESTLAGLRRTFDERLSVLQGRSAATRLQSRTRGRAKWVTR